MNTTTTTGRLQPVARAERIERLDVLRGFALFGVLAANLILASRVPVAPEGAVSLGMALLDPIADGLYVFFVRGKAYSLFAFLFGFGFALQLARAESRGVAHAPIFARRMGWLLVFGTAHCLLLWWGDILHVYALAGFVLLALRRAARRTLLVLGLLLAFGYPLGYWTYRLLRPPSAAVSASVEAGPEQLEARLAALREGGYVEVLAENFRVITLFLRPEILGATFACSLGLFLLGCWVGRGRRLEAARLEQKPFTRVLAAGLLVGIPLNFVVVGFRVLGWENPGASVWYGVSATIGVPALAAAYLALLVLLFERPAWRRRLSWLAVAGRMALTLYLMHSLFFFGLLYGVGPGLGLAGRIGPALGFLIAAGIFAFQVPFARWWLARFRFGPAEWLWRSLTYGERQPFRRLPRGQPALLGLTPACRTSHPGRVSFIRRDGSRLPTP